MSIAIACLSSSVLVALLNNIWTSIKEARQRKRQKGTEPITALTARVETLETQTAALVEAQRLSMMDRIKWLGTCYIADGKVDFFDRQLLNQMHGVYHNQLGGNGDLDNIMTAVNNLPLK